MLRVLPPLPVDPVSCACIELCTVLDQQLDCIHVSTASSFVDWLPSIIILEAESFAVLGRNLDKTLDVTCCRSLVALRRLNLLDRRKRRVVKVCAIRGDFAETIFQLRVSQE
jgi:hypothetical protein